MTSTMPRLTTGSSHSQPVHHMAAAATTTPAEMAASAAMCRKAPRMFRSSLEPFMNIRAVAVLMTMPMPATIITGPVWIGCGSAKRRTASQAMAPTATSSTTALVSEARIVPLRRP